ncbi:MAG: hypothetical protein HC934_08775 [Acaryochloridaceae cyanobacterium SU_2_1]|nr:hypothetical protein [Acaryochloridaceae cyanobacterium SU_2_1]
MRQIIVGSCSLMIPLLLGILPIQAQTSVPGPAGRSQTDPFFLTRAKNLARQAAERQNGGLNFYRAEPSMYGPAINSPHIENQDSSVTFTFTGGSPGFTTPTIETIAIVSPTGNVTLTYNGPLRSAVSPTQQQPTDFRISVSPPPRQSILIPTTPPPVQPTVAVQPTNRASVLPTLRPVSPPPAALISSQPQPSSAVVIGTGPAITPTSPAAVAPSLPTGGLSEVPSVSAVLVSPSVVPISPRPTLPSIATTQGGVQGIDADLFLSRAKNIARQTAINVNGGLGNYRPEASMFGPAATAPHVKNSDGSITFRFSGGIPGYTIPSVETIVTVAPNNAVTLTYNGPIR